MKKGTPGPKKMVHMVIGTPDMDNCEICRAHAQAAVDPVIDGADGPIRVQELSLSEILRCPCPLCTQARKDTPGD
jgi:hypothetical protein